MIAAFYAGLLLSELAFDPLDKAPLLMFGLYGLLRLILRRGRRPSSSESWFALFVAYLFLSILFVKNPQSVAVYAAYYLLQFGLLSYVIAELRMNPFFFVTQMKRFVQWQSFVAFVGVVDLLLFVAGYESPIRDHVRSWKVDSFFQSPNVFGVTSAIAVIYLRNWVYKSTLAPRWLLVLLNMSAVLMSGSSMALLVVLLSEVIKHVGFRVGFLLGSIALAIGFEFIQSEIPDLLNRRLEIWTAGVEAWIQSPVFGIGTGNFQKLHSVIIAGVEFEGVYGLHSLYMWLLIETGIIGAFLFGMFVFTLLRRLYSTSWRYAFYTLPMALFVTQLTENFLDHEEVIIALFWLMVGSIVVIRKDVK